MAGAKMNHMTKTLKLAAVLSATGMLGTFAYGATIGAARPTVKFNPFNPTRIETVAMTGPTTPPPTTAPALLRPLPGGTDTPSPYHPPIRDPFAPRPRSPFQP